MRSAPFIIVKDAYGGGVASFVRARFFSHGVRRGAALKATWLNDRPYIAPEPPEVDTDEVVVDRVIGWQLKQGASDLHATDLSVMGEGIKAA